MSRFDELIMAAREQRDCDNRFLVAANSFPEQLRQRLCGYLNAPEALVQFRSAASGPAWQWPPFTGFDTGDQDPDDGQFTFAISIHVGAFGDFSIVAPTFRFKPVLAGFEAVILDRRPVKCGQRDTPRFEIFDDDDWQPLLDQCFDLCRETLSFDPFEEIARPPFMGLDTGDATT